MAFHHFVISKLTPPFLTACLALLLAGCATLSPGKATVHETLETTLEPGIWHGFSLGPSSDDCAYLAEISPLEPSSDGASIEKDVVQPEFNGKTWNDVLRVSIPKSQKSLKVQIRVYKIAAKPKS